MTPKDASALRAMVGGSGSDELKGLDVTILHSVIFDQILGSEGLEALSYSRDAQDAWRTVNEGAAAAFLMEPPTVDVFDLPPLAERSCRKRALTISRKS